MAWRTILVPMVGEEGDRKALDGATKLAKDFGAHVNAVLVLRDPKEALSAVGEGMSSTMIEKIYEAALDSASATEKVAKEIFDAWQSETGVDASFGVETGAMEDVAAHLGRTMDVICARRPTEEDTGDIETVVVSSALESGRPVLMSDEEANVGFGGVAAVCWNGSKEAARAVAMAAPLLAEAKTVKVVCGLGSDVSVASAEALVETLKKGGTNAALHTFQPNGGITGVDLCVEARKLNADYMVIGAYSHSRLREYVFGGVTEDILQAAALPVLMAG